MDCVAIESYVDCIDGGDDMIAITLCAFIEDDLQCVEILKQ